MWDKGRWSGQRELLIKIRSTLIDCYIFLSYALAFAEILKANSIFIGVNAVDYSGMFGRMGAFTDISSRQMLGG